jgi:hypothetical protein
MRQDTMIPLQVIDCAGIIAVARWNSSVMRKCDNPRELT